MAIEQKILTFGTNKVGTIGGKLMGFVNPILKAVPYVWYNNDLDTISKTGADRVSEWRDSSGNGRHLTQATGGSQPLWVDSLLNGQGGINFDGASTAKFLSTTFASDLTGVVDVFFVGRMLTAPSTFPYYFGGVSATKRIIMYWLSNNYYLVTTDPSGELFPAIKAQTIPTGFQYMNPTFDSTNSEYRENRTLISSFVLRSVVASGLRFGANQDNPPNVQSRLNGTIMEFVAYNRKVTADERIAINDYFMSKYGL
jgi:hypothetical protein